MKIRCESSSRLAFTLLDLVVVVGMLAILATLLLFSLGIPRAKSKRIQCVHNLKNIGLSFRIVATDHGDRLFGNPSRGGTDSPVKLEQSFQIFERFLSISNELSSGRILICPADTRSPADSSKTPANSNVSYFAGLNDWQTSPNALLAGDRNITNGVAPNRGVLEFTRSRPAGWTHEIHRNKGNVVMGDGSVQETTTSSLNDMTQQEGPTPVRILLPE